ncbi:SNF7 family protein (macronuclear) [Tetrahymena thermophila SB210]|uniref:SNF7 family protein n=1 Tax=Tetrahymena thermophila (strain SB210) TaxID=312017 RepID=Q23RA8_TETTS|nr:SNF7 family protein [Tetrahymena thermophila SB210]EAR99140.3 SNF7 family protein [Tetrahymena thermophila SB210]|eukprot:XP_001019385.3 SNF7 family protein [Tetrahymena thermophila SB210]
MGGSQPKPAPVKQPTMDEILIDMRMAAKRFENDARRAEKEKAKQFEKAQQALKKNNEEGAKMYLQNMMQKDKEMKMMQRMANKLDSLQITIKSNTSSTVMMQQINKIAPILYNQSQQIPTEQIYSDMDRFEKSMDEIMVTGKVMDEVLNNQYGNDVQANQNVDAMLNQLKLENLNSIQNNLNGDNMQMFKDLKQNEFQAQNNNNQVINNQNK